MKLQGIASLQKVPDGPAGINLTLRIMKNLIREGKKDFTIRRKAMDLVYHNGQKAYAAEVNDLFTFVRDRIRYIKDINEVETVAAPQITLELGQGDCDDKVVLLASLLESIGHKTRSVALALQPGVFSHVILETKIGNRWVALDPTEPVQMGWYPPGVVNRMVIYNGSGKGFEI